ncbi:MAG: nitrite reductase small subunit NirD [Cellvibrionaceae bacterium]|nr:nitrite reductase small subunit NirD [Cellvibrionaceae bacterium]
MGWQIICDSQELLEMVGVRALVDDRQVAIFRVKGKFYAIDAIDPFTSAAVLARGVVGSLNGQVVVASPLLKQHFNLETGQCLEDDAVHIKTYDIRENTGKIEVLV